MPPPGLRIRPAVPQDNHSKQRVVDAAWISGHGHLFPRSVERLLRGERPEETFSYEYPRDKGIPIVADIRGQVVGVIDLRPLPDGSLLIEPIAVDPAFQRHRVGSELWKAAETLARRRDYRALVVWAVDGNKKAQGFYASQGCTPFASGKVMFDGVEATATGYRLDLAQPAGMTPLNVDIQ